MFLVSWAATLAALALLAPRPLNFTAMMGAAATTALGAALVEAFSPWGIGNLTVPAVSAVVLAWLL